MSKIVLLENIHPNAVAHLAAFGLTNVVQIPAAVSGPELLAALSGADAVGIRSRTQMTDQVLAALPDLKTIGCFCIGTNQVNLTAAAQHGVPVFNAPYSNTRSVAELVIAQAILLLRRIPEKNAHAHRGVWDKNAQGAFEVRNKVIGIIGYGKIGDAVARRAR
ncbi:MAG: NAD(P)-dependent oxidoreductase, partial [Oxalobacteraceae bacterium]